MEKINYIRFEDSIKYSNYSYMNRYLLILLIFVFINNSTSNENNTVKESNIINSFNILSNLNNLPPNLLL